MAYIDFTDGIGYAVLRPCAPQTAAAAGKLVGRLRAWTPRTRVVGPSQSTLATGQLYVMRYRTDYGASFTLPGISAHYDGYATSAFPLEIADRLCAHATAGGVFSVYTEDNAGSAYSVSLAPGSEPQLRQTDPRALEYELALSVVRADGVAAPMVCRYGRLT